MFLIKLGSKVIVKIRIDASLTTLFSFFNKKIPGVLSLDRVSNSLGIHGVAPLPLAGRLYFSLIRSLSVEYGILKCTEA
ncbi:hypothetical protein BpHYR1_046432 [Brachionus plicatilis]|uniref:Uncharacterized protein n=1 Tax=Brachionus plicatilis TaxID=10195 RepID=A0A3M7Q3U7_BRAPC|nr:hypothetical protein BpHYR1_046432 [Brachionus plicatilis]